MTVKGKEGEPLVFECDLDAPPEKVWRALTVPAIADAWLGDPSGADDRRCYEIVDTEPFTRVRLAWREPGEDRPTSEVIFEIEPRPGGRTRFRLTHAAKTPVSAANGNAPPVALAA